MMRTAILILFFGAFMFGCNDDEQETFDQVAQFQKELELIDQYITDNGVTDTLHHETGIRYKIVRAGTGLEARPGDKLRVKYDGWLLENDEPFDSSEQFDFILNTSSVILGWVYMCEEMREGDTFLIFIPSFYGYAQRGQGSIPPNSPLIFEITLIRVGD
jgi:FKBP-type peptidyl-prolyl cis-trans isomerase